MMHLPLFWSIITITPARTLVRTPEHAVTTPLRQDTIDEVTQEPPRTLTLTKLHKLEQGDMGMEKELDTWVQRPVSEPRPDQEVRDTPLLLNEFHARSISP